MTQRKKYDFEDDLAPGDRGDSVRSLQNALKDLLRRPKSKTRIVLSYRTTKLLSLKWASLIRGRKIAG